MNTTIFADPVRRLWRRLKRHRLDAILALGLMAVSVAAAVWVDPKDVTYTGSGWIPVWTDGHWGTQHVDGHNETRTIDGHYEEQSVPGHEETTWVDGYWDTTWSDGYYDTVWNDGHYEDTWHDGYSQDVWHDGYYDDDDNWNDGYTSTEWVDGYTSTDWVDGYWSSNWVDGHWDQTWVDGHNETTWVDGYTTQVWVPETTETVWVDGYDEPVWIDGGWTLGWGEWSVTVHIDGHWEGDWTWTPHDYVGDWSDWSWSPSTDSQPGGATFTQNGSRVRSHVHYESNEAGDIQGLTSTPDYEYDSHSATGTGPVAWTAFDNPGPWTGNSPWTPDASTIALGVQFTQTSSGSSRVHQTGEHGSDGSVRNTSSYVESGGPNVTQDAVGTKPAGGAPVITSSVSMSATIALDFNYTITAVNSPTSFDATGLPAGLSVDKSTGVISGQPTQYVGSPFAVTISAKNALGTGTATLALSVDTLAIVTPPQSQNAAVGTTVTFSVSAVGLGPFTYHWQKDGTDISGATNASYSRLVASTADAGVYSVDVSNGIGSVGASATLTVGGTTGVHAFAMEPLGFDLVAGGTHFRSFYRDDSPLDGQFTWISSPPKYYAWHYYPPGTNSQYPTRGSVEFTITPTEVRDYVFRVGFTTRTSSTPISDTVTLHVTPFPLSGQANLALPSGMSPQAFQLPTTPTHWAVANPSTTYADGSHFDLDPKSIWNTGNGGSPDITVLVMDTGVQDKNPALTNVVHANFASDGDVNPNGLPFPQYLFSPNNDDRYVNGPGSMTEEDQLRAIVESHGTKVAGAVAALYLNLNRPSLHGTAIGTAPGVRIAAARISKGDPETGGLFIPTLAVMNAINWGLGEGARVSVSSFRTYFNAGSLDAAFEDARDRELAKSYYTSPYQGSAEVAGMVHFVASGNDSTANLDNAYPANLPSVNAIGAVTSAGVRAPFSNYGTGLAFVAPGDAVTTGYPTWFPRKPGSSELSLGFTEEIQQSWGLTISVTAGSSKYPAVHMTYAARLAASAPLIYGGLGTTTNPNWNGKVVLLDRGTNFFYEKANNVAQSGGVACIIANNNPGGFGGTLIDANNNPQRSSIPVLAISQEDGVSLKNQVGTTTTINRTFDWIPNFPNSGTSFAAPFAAGVAALTLSQNPTWTAAMVEARLQATAKRMPSWAPGYDTQYGWGMPNAREALKPGLFEVLDLSTRAQVNNAAGQELIMGFVITGTQSKPMLIRAVGSTLGTFGVSGTLSNPTLTLRGEDGSVVAANTNWTTAGNASAIQTATTALGIFSLPAGNGDSAMLIDLPPGAYTAAITSSNSSSGVALAEVYDASGTEPVNARLVNVASRAFVGTGQSVMIGGFILHGNSPRSVLIRAVGPSLNGVSGTLAHPQLRLLRWNGSGWDVVATNSDWGSAPNARAIRGYAAAVGAFPLADGSQDAAILIGLSGGMYSAEVTSADGTTGIALVEVYPAVD